MDRRSFIAVTGGGLATLLAAPVLSAQGSAGQTMSGPMRAEAYIPVVRPPRVGVASVVSTERRDELEKHLKCLCGCPMDVYLCRTTDFKCPVSPRVHADIEALIAGGYSEDEIREAFITTYGERVLTAPKAQGFNLLAYVAPFAAIGSAALFVGWLLHRWRNEAVPVDVSLRIPQAAGTADELARLEAAVRNDDQ
jgi:cytochrome c-type biogenesis protein CcmH